MNKVFTQLLIILFLGSLSVFAKDSGHKYVGAKKCKTCHKKEKEGKQYIIWQEGPHAKAMEALASPKALKIAKEKGIADPAKEPACIKCHSTFATLKPEQLHPKSKLTLEEGVSCESCHGAGADYKKKKIMKDLDKAKSKGLIIPDEKVCKNCHNSDSPTFESFDFDKYFDKIKHPRPKKK